MPLDDFLQREIDVGSFSSASYAIGSSAGILRENALGHAVAVPFRIPATVDTLYDCASITKVLITTPLVLQLLPLDEQVVRLLTHTSGLRAWMPLYAYPDPLRALREDGPEYEPGTRVVYSDLNFILLWSMLDDYVGLAQSRIFLPLGLTDAMFRPPCSLLPRIAATEWGQRFEPRLAGRWDIPGLRQGLMWGDTNDGNSHHLGHGTAGNAGLFATARAVFRIAQAFVRGELVSRELVTLATRNHTIGLNESRGLGWQLASPSNAATSMLSAGSFGHMGFTGTSVWIDPARDRIMVLLTNRVHPCAASIGMARVRGELHRLALAAD